MDRSGILLFSFFMLILCYKINAQDAHHSQYYTSALNYNPANTGLFAGDQRVAVNYRRQWFVDDIVRYLTISGSYDFKLYPKRWTTKGLWNFGLLFNYDQAGDSKLGLASLFFSSSYSYPLNNSNIIIVGGAAGYTHRRFKPDELQWGAQYNGLNFDPTLPTEENFASTSNGFFDFNVGLNYRWQKSTRTKIDFGIAAFHLSGPDQKFFDQSLEIKLPVRLSLQLQPQFKLSNSFDLLLHGLFQQQQKYNELLAGGYLRIYLNQARGKELNLLLGASTRFDDAIIPKIAVEYLNWRGGISYDITNSGFESAVNNRGGPEFSLVYIYTKARVLKLLKSCPIF